jgi:nitrate/nitrite-specific signal transduction histidine kinase
VNSDKERDGGRLWRALASIRHARRSLSGKLMVVMLATTTIALAAAGAALLLTDLRDNRAQWAADLSTEASILSLAVQPALSFDDVEYAQRNLNAMQARDSIRVAALYLPDGTLFAQYSRTDAVRAPARKPGFAGSTRIDGGRVEVQRPVTLEGQILGSIYLHAEYDVSARVRAYLSVLGAVTIIGMIAALLASSWLQRVVSQPMESMANVARQIVQRRDYSYRAEKQTDDEIGVVVDAFNSMLDEVQAHSRALETSEKLYRASPSTTACG